MHTTQSAANPLSLKLVSAIPDLLVCQTARYVSVYAFSDLSQSASTSVDQSMRYKVHTEPSGSSSPSTRSPINHRLCFFKQGQALQQKSWCNELDIRHGNLRLTLCMYAETLLNLPKQPLFPDLAALRVGCLARLVHITNNQRQRNELCILHDRLEMQIAPGLGVVRANRRWRGEG